MVSKNILVFQRTPPPSILLLSLGLVFSVATQLRIPGASFGVGEALLILWLLSTLFLPRNWRNPALIGLLTLTGVGVLLLSAGYFFMPYPAGGSRPPALHDTLAYAFCAVLAINYTSLANEHESRFPHTVLWAFLTSALLALILGVMAKKWSGLDAMYYQTRWQHLSAQPNQFALMALPLPFLSLYWILRQPKNHNIFVPTIAHVLALALGLYSRSDALSLAWIGGGLVAALALFGNFRTTPIQFFPVERLSHRARITAGLLIMLMVGVSAWQWREVATSIILNGGSETGAGTRADLSGGASAGAPSDECSDVKPQSPSDADRSQENIRLCLWRNGVAAIQYAPFTGLGPGPHSGFQKPFEGREAHNTLIDWGTQTGVIGVAVLLAYLLWVLWQVARRGQYELTAMILALYCFAMFHLTLRQPLFWIVPLLAWGLALSGSQGRITAPPST